MWMTIGGIALAVGAAVSYGIYWEVRRIGQKRDRFATREELSLDSIFANFYVDSGIDKTDFQYLWTNVARLLSLNAGKLRPEDRFDTELRPVLGKEISDEIEDVYDFLQNESEARKLQFEPRNYHTLDDVVRAFARRS